MTARYWYTDEHGTVKTMEWRPVVTEEEKKPAEKPDDKEQDLDEDEQVKVVVEPAPAEVTTTTETKTAL